MSRALRDYIDACVLIAIVLYAAISVLALLFVCLETEKVRDCEQLNPKCELIAVPASQNKAPRRW